MIPVEFRCAQPSDVKIAVPILYSSGLSEFDYSFNCGEHKAPDFLAYAFADGRGFFGWRNQTVATLNDEVVAIAAFYSGQEYLRLSMFLVWQVFRFYPLNIIPHVLWHMFQLQSRMPKPKKTMHYVANFAVRKDMQSQNIGSALLLNQLAIAKKLGRTLYALDVSADNPRAQALYERLGFKAIKINKFTGNKSSLADTLRMEMPIGS